MVSVSIGGTVVSEHYQMIAEYLLKTCPADFEEITLKIEAEDDHTLLQAFCLKDGETTQPRVPLRDHYEISKALWSLRDEMAEVGNGDKWSSAVFVLKPGGKFKFDVDYG